MDRTDDWRERAACRGIGAEVFFPVNDEEAGPAQAICAGCPVRAECLEWALETRQQYGVWGGLTETERKRVRRRRQAARRAG